MPCHATLRSGGGCGRGCGGGGIMAGALPVRHPFQDRSGLNAAVKPERCSDHRCREQPGGPLSVLALSGERLTLREGGRALQRAFEKEVRVLVPC